MSDNNFFNFYVTDENLTQDTVEESVSIVSDDNVDENTKEKLKSDLSVFRELFYSVDNRNFSCALESYARENFEIRAFECRIESGYGNEGTWDIYRVLTPEHGAMLNRYATAKIKLAGIFLIYEDKSYFISQSYCKVEASEKSTISFILGGVWTYLAAKICTDARNDRIKHFLHFSIYNAAKPRKPALVPVPAESKSSPDYILKTDNQWLLYESKGTEWSNRWKQVKKGFGQLRNISKINLKGGHQANVSSVTCVATGVDAGKKIKLLVADPEPSAGDEEDIDLVVCELFLLLNIIEFYTAAKADGDSVASRHKDLISFTPSGTSEVLLLVPEVIIDHENLIRTFLAMHFVFIELINFYSQKEIASEEKIKSSLINVINRTQCNSYIKKTFIEKMNKLFLTGIVNSGLKDWLTLSDVITQDKDYIKFKQILDDVRKRLSKRYSSITSSGVIVLDKRGIHPSPDPDNNNSPPPAPDKPDSSASKTSANDSPDRSDAPKGMGPESSQEEEHKPKQSRRRKPK